MEFRIGISGWRYEPWRGVFYPDGLTQKRELEFASRQFNSIELNGSFYSLQTGSSWKKWYEETPTGFVFAVKGSRYITHMKRLKSIDSPLANFFAQGILSLKEKLGPILWQFPPRFHFDPEVFEAFFRMLPRDTRHGAALARRAPLQPAGLKSFRVGDDRTLRHAVEIRHPSFVSQEFFALLRKYNIALVVADTAGKWPFVTEVTSDFMYVRLHGDKQLYVSGYTSAALTRWSSLVSGWLNDGLDVYVYFDNDVKVRAPFDALALAKRVERSAKRVHHRSDRGRKSGP